MAARWRSGVCLYVYVFDVLMEMEQIAGDGAGRATKKKVLLLFFFFPLSPFRSFYQSPTAKTKEPWGGYVK